MSLLSSVPAPSGWYYISQILLTMTLYGCHATCPWECIWQMWVAVFVVTSLPVKNNTSSCPLQRWMAERNVPSQNDTMTEKLTSCDTQKNRKTNITKQLNGTKHNVLPPPNKSWLGCEPCRITVSHYQAAAQQLTEYNRAKESLWSPYGKTWTVKQDTRGLWNRQLSQYRQRTLMARWLHGPAKYCMYAWCLQEQHGRVRASYDENSTRTHRETHEP